MENIKSFNPENEPRLCTHLSVLSGDELLWWIAKRASRDNPGSLVVVYVCDEDSLYNLVGYSSAEDIPEKDVQVDYDEVSQVEGVLSDDFPIAILTFQSKFEITQFKSQNEISDAELFVAKDGNEVSM